MFLRLSWLMLFGWPYSDTPTLAYQALNPPDFVLVN